MKRTKIDRQMDTIYSKQDKKELQQILDNIQTLHWLELEAMGAIPVDFKAKKRYKK
jgi:hypothetical protein